MPPHAPSAVTVPARVLAIAGSDSGGGAGIQADIKTLSALGAYAMTAITAVTVQNTTGVLGFHPVPANIIADQIGATLRDIGADAIKTGMLVSEACVAAVADALKPFARVPLVVDTVIVAKGGAALLDDAGVEAMKTRLFPLAALVTPNAPEAARLSGIAVEGIDDLVLAAKRLLDLGARAVLAKGGHLPGETVTDVLVDSSGTRLFRGPRIEAKATHGTGCTLASAVAAGLAQGMTLDDAVQRARHFVREAIRTGLSLGRGTGPINHLHAIRPFRR